MRLDELRPGMVVGRAVYNLQNILLLKEGAVLTEKTISVLKTWGVPAVFIHEDSECMMVLGGRPDEDTCMSIEKQLHKKFADHLDNPIMAEINRVAKIQIQKRITNRPN